MGVLVELTVLLASASVVLLLREFLLMLRPSQGCGLCEKALRICVGMFLSIIIVMVTFLYLSALFDLFQSISNAHV